MRQLQRQLALHVRERFRHRHPTATPAPARATSSGSQLTTVDLVEQLRPSVVHILSETSSFNVFGQVVPQQGVGTGIILDADGHIVTNNHVITDANGSPVDKITVTLSDNNQYEATIVGRDAPTDLAVLKITASSLRRPLSASQPTSRSART